MWGGVFFRQPSHGKRHLCTLVSLPFTHDQSPSVRPCCMCSLPGMHEPGFDFGPCPSCSKQRGWAALPFSSPKSPQSGQAQGSSQLHLFSHQYNLPGGNQLRAGSYWCQVKATEGTLWICAIRHTLLALGEASNASSQPWQCCGRTAVSPSGMLPGILLSCQAAKPLWLMFRSACMGSSTSLGVGENQGFCHPNQCFNRCLYLLGWWCLDLPPPRVSGLPPLTERPFPLFIVLLQSALSSESIL